jgi:hypothetical protein
MRRNEGTNGSAFVCIVLACYFSPVSGRLPFVVCRLPFALCLLALVVLLLCCDEELLPGREPALRVQHQALRHDSVHNVRGRLQGRV